MPGSSACVERSEVCWQSGHPGVPAALIAEHGAVSEPVARAMAKGICAASIRVGIGVTGIAGPTAALQPWNRGDRGPRAPTPACGRFSSWACARWSSFNRAGRAERLRLMLS
jgi:hypothetical protein